MVAGSELGLGCGTPTQFAALATGEAVLDLGSGAGVDVFLAAHRVGAAGRVVGVDLTESMVVRARRTDAANGYDNVEFVLSDIERLPFDDHSFDCVLSYCVINLAPDKRRVFGEVLRVLRPSGSWLSASDCHPAAPRRRCSVRAMLRAAVLECCDLELDRSGRIADYHPRRVKGRHDDCSCAA